MQQEGQKYKARVREIRKRQNEGAIVVDLMSYDNPPAVYDPNNLVTEQRLQAVAGGATLTPQERSVSGISDPVQVPVPTGYSKYKANVYLPNGQQANDRIVIDPGGTIDNANLYVNTLGDTVLVVFF